MKHCETFEHTADVGLAARGDTLPELMEALAEGLAEFITPRGKVRPRHVRIVGVQAEDLEALTVDFLSKVLYVIQTDHFLVSRAKVTDVSQTAVAAELMGETYDPAHHDLHMEVKGITYHKLAIEQQDGAWTGRVILDL
jgi:SHS2 domain-containing protein